MNTKKLIRPLYSIGTVARLTGVSAHSLRAWDRRYGLSASQRDEAGRRVYSQADLDHLSLVKHLVDQGVKIGDIARMPSDTLRLMAEDAKAGSTEKHVLVIGNQACHLIDKHQIRFRGYHCELFDLNFLQDEDNKESIDIDPWVMLLDIESLSMSLVENIETLIKKHPPKHSILVYRYASELMIEKLVSLGVRCVKAAVNVDLLIKELNFFNTHVEKFQDKSLRSAPARFFSDDQLTEIIEDYTRSDCACPRHITELIKSLAAFEEYCLSCEVENKKDAALHSSIYSHAAKSRHLMERALQVMIDHHY